MNVAKGKYCLLYLTHGNVKKHRSFSNGLPVKDELHAIVFNVSFDYSREEFSRKTGMWSVSLSLPPPPQYQVIVQDFKLRHAIRFPKALNLLLFLCCYFLWQQPAE